MKLLFVVLLAMQAPDYRASWDFLGVAKQQVESQQSAWEFVEPKETLATEQPAAKKHAVIEAYYLATYCPGCEVFKSEKHRLEAVGWTIDEHVHSGPSPQFFVWINGVRYGKLTGYRGMAQFGDWLTLVKRRASGTPEVVTTTPVVRRVTSNYRPRWTWPGNLGYHLRTTHGIDTTGMTQDDMERTHDALHEGRRMTTRQPARRVMRSG